MPTKIDRKIGRLKCILKMVCLVGVVLWIASAVHAHYIHVRYGFQWFDESLPSASDIKGYSDDDLDKKLHHLSKWHCEYEGFRNFVKLTVEPLRLLPNQTFHFLELGVGVGAFARLLLKDFPISTMMGVDHSQKAIAIADVVLPKNRSKVLVGDMAALTENFGSFDVILSPGSLCYLRSLRVVRNSVAQFMRMLHKGGGFCASMLPVSWDELGSCSTFIPESFWSSVPQFCLVSVESMQKWPVSGEDIVTAAQWENNRCASFASVNKTANP